MDRWTQVLSGWAACLCVILLIVAATGTDESGTPAVTADEDAEPTPRPTQPQEPAPAQPAASDNESDGTTYVAHQNVSATGNGQWTQSFDIDLEDAANLTVALVYEPRDGQATWHTTSESFEVVDPNGTEHWGWTDPFNQGAGPAVNGVQLNATGLPTGLWDFRFQWGGPSDVKLTLQVYVERDAA